MNRELTVQSNNTIACPLVLDRTSQFAGPLPIELIDPPAGLTAAPMSIASGQSGIEVIVWIDPFLKLPPNLKLKFRVQGTMGGDTQVISKTSLPIKRQIMP